MTKPTLTESTEDLTNGAAPVGSSQASLVNSSGVEPSASDKQGASTQYITIDKIRVKRDHWHFPEYSLSFTLHRDSRFDGGWWEDVAVWKSLSALSILTAQAYIYQKTLAEQRRRLKAEALLRAARKGHRENRSEGEFIPFDRDLYDDDWEAFVTDCLEDPTFNSDGIRIERSSSRNFVTNLTWSNRGSHGQSRRQTKLEPTLQVENHFSDDEAGRLCIALAEVKKKNSTHQYRFFAHVSDVSLAYKNYQYLRTIKIKDGPSIDLVDTTRWLERRSEDNGSDDT